MNINSLLITSILASVATFFVMLKRARDKAERLQREQDVSNIKASAEKEVSDSDSKHLLELLNSEVSRSKRSH